MSSFCTDERNCEFCEDYAECTGYTDEDSDTIDRLDDGDFYGLE